MLLFRLPVLHAALPARRPRAASGERRGARRAVLSGACAFALLTFGLVLATEAAKPEWRDPEFGHRLNRARAWQRDRPDRPLVVVLGSSRAQMGVAPGAMGFPDEAGSPLVYNFGYRANSPLGMWLHASRLLDAGVRPRAVVLMLALSEIGCNAPAEEQFRSRDSTLSLRDLCRLAEYTSDRAGPARELAGRWCNPLPVYWNGITSDLAPQWQSGRVRADHESWEAMDEYGWVPFPAERLFGDNRRKLLTCRQTHAQLLDSHAVGPVSDRALRSLIARCRAEGVAVAACWAPESPACRAHHPPEWRAQVDAYTRVLERECGAAVFPAPGHLAEADFADGYHLLPGGAAEYSRWLADAHLKPWLAGLAGE